MTDNEQDPPELPLAGIRVVEFTHMVMGPTCGMVLADLGAEVIKVEPVAGDNTRKLLGSGAGFFPLFNRNKKSIALDLQHAQGREAVLRLVATADVVSENFKPGTMARLGLDYASLARLNERLVYVSHKGFLPGPYDHRTALDEVVQMMGGLAYMTGRPGDPLRAGSSVNDIMGGMFGAIGAMAALAQRNKTGKGQEVQSALFENNVFLVAQHMMQFTVTGKPAAPMPGRISAWGIYDVFTVKDGEQVFLAVVSDTQWKVFCEAFGYQDLWADARLRSNNDRVLARDWLLPELRARLADRSAAELSAIFERNALPFAPITRPEDLLADPHLLATGGLAPMQLPDGREAPTVLLPLSLDGRRPGVRHNPPLLGQHTHELLRELGYSDAQIESLQEAGVCASASQDRAVTTTHLLYLHGFRSSPQSTKAQKMAARVRERYPQVHWWCPQLPASPRAAMQMVMQGIAGWPTETMAVAGSSLGGFYATCVAEAVGCRAVLLNPAIDPARDLAPHTGEQTAWHDPSEHFVFEPGFVDELRALQCGPIARPDRYFAVIAKGDEVLDWREMAARYPGAKIKLLEGGDHALSDFDRHIDEVFAFLGLA